MLSSHSPFRSVFQYLIHFFVASAMACALSAASMGQDPSNYSLQTGKPSFSTTEPFPGGYVNIANGNVHLDIALGNYPQRGGKTVAFSLAYNSRVWSLGSYWDYSKDWKYIPNGDTELGWRINGALGGSAPNDPGVFNCGNNNGGPCYWKAPDGAVHMFSVNPNSAPSFPFDVYANDNSGYHLYGPGVGGVYEIYEPDGALVFTSNLQWSCNPCGTNVPFSEYYVLRDANGNLFDWVIKPYSPYVSPYQSPTLPTDTLGRAPFSDDFGGGVSNGGIRTNTLTVLNSQGAFSTYTFAWAIGIYIAPTFGGGYNCSPNTSAFYCYNLDFLQSITLPDGSSYSFSYDCDAQKFGTTVCSNNNGYPTGNTGTYGLLTSVKLPTGGTVNFTYTNFTDATHFRCPAGFPCTGYTNRWVNTVSYNGGTWTYTPATGCGNYCQTVTVSRPNGATRCTHLMSAREHGP